mgnify:CR=1 FL=1
MYNLEIAIVIPIYNEEIIINKVVDEILQKLKDKKFIIILINDGSTDNTEEKLKKYNKLDNIKIINKKNQGHGPSLIRGYNEAIKHNPKFIFQIDSDDQIPFDEFFKIYHYPQNINIISGYRKKRKDPLIRLITTLILKIIILIVHQVLIKDSNVPFRLIKKEFLDENIAYIKNSNIPNVLLSILASRKNSLLQLPVKHKERFTGVASITKFKLFFFSIKCFFEILKFKISEKNS